MSSKQLRKLRSLREADGAVEAKARDPGADHGPALPHEEPADEESSASDAESGNGAQTAGFAALVGSDSDSGDNADAPAPSASAEAKPTATTGAGSSASARRRRRKAVAARVADGRGSAAADGPDAEDEDEALLEEAAAAAAGSEAELDSGQGPAVTTTFEAGVLAMRRADFSVEKERRRVMGGRGGFVGVGGAENTSGPGRRFAARQRGAAEGRTAHHRRLCIVVPTAEEPWPRPDDCVAMVSATDGLGAAVFDFEETAESAKALKMLRRCLAAQDPQLLQHFLEQNPFCVDGLLTLAEYFRSQQSHEKAFQLVRKAAYAVECSFSPGFSPFQQRGVGPSALRPCVVLRMSDDPAWPGWSWLRTLWMHMQGLASQGLHRSALEGCKLLVASTLPRDPCRALFCFDFLCLRSRQYDSLARLSRDLVPQYGLQDEEGGAVSSLDLAFPNFAYSVALAGFLKAGQPPDMAALNEVSIDDVAPPIASAGAADGTDPAAAPEGAAAHARLMRALLLFPLALRPLLDEAGAKLQGPAPGGSPSRQSWTDLLARPPFSDAADFRHQRHAAAHARICGAYAKRCGSLWRADLALRWLHACTARLVSMYESSVFATELSTKRAAWCEAPLCLSEALEKDYPDLLPDEGVVEAPKLPPVLEQALQARLHPPREEWDDEMHPNPGGFPGMPAWAGGDAPPERLVPTISIHSPPLLVFFQSLMPWGELDRSGVAVEPLSWSDVGRGAAGAVRGMALFAAGAAADVARLAAGLVAAQVQRARGRPP